MIVYHSVQTLIMHWAQLRLATGTSC